MKSNTGHQAKKSSFNIDNELVNRLAGSSVAIDGESESRFIDIQKRWLPNILDPWGRMYRCDLNWSDPVGGQIQQQREILSVIVRSERRASAEVRIMRRDKPKN